MGSYNRLNRTCHKTMINLDRFTLEGDKPEINSKMDPVFRVETGLWVHTIGLTVPIIKP